MSTQAPEIDPEVRTGSSSRAIDLRAAKSKRLLVVGEVVLDRYLWGTVERVSPEAPIPVLHLTRTEERLGNAAFVAASVHALGGDARLLSIVGADADGGVVRRLAAHQGLEWDSVLEVAARPTTVKERILGAAQHAQRGVQQMLRVDREDPTPLDRTTEAALLNKLGREIEAADGVLVCDINKGLLTDALLSQTIRLARDQQKPVIIDPRRTNDFSIYRGATALTPNRFEAQLATGLDLSASKNWPVAAKRLVDEFDLAATLVTLDRDGMFFWNRAKTAIHIETTPREVYDVTGAGDVVLAAFGFLWMAGLQPIDAAIAANVAASLEVTRQGATIISRSELATALRGHCGSGRKVCSLEELRSQLDGDRQRGRKVSFIEWNLDLDAHNLQLLEFAQAQGELLVAWLPSSRDPVSVSHDGRLQGSAKERAQLLAAMEAVDYVVSCGSLEPLEIVRAIRPDVVIAALDARSTMSDEVLQFVRSYGGRTMKARTMDDASNSDIIDFSNHRASADNGLVVVPTSHSDSASELPTGTEPDPEANTAVRSTAGSQRPDRPEYRP
jgi:D-beta-D-heptose 7-phosphate kinase/D-beta-D-heptose 1-phosphate adenosyltransferase